MTRPVIRLASPPTMVIHYPTCSACDVDLDHDGDSFACPKCGTTWDDNAGDGDEGTLYSDWSGEDVDDIPLVDEHKASTVPWIQHPFVSLFPDLRTAYYSTCKTCYHQLHEHVGEVAS